MARIHAENAIRQKNQSLNYLRMSARVDATASRVQSAVTTKKVTKSMEVRIAIRIFVTMISMSNPPLHYQGVVKGMSAAMKSMNLEKISGLMDQFEKEFEDLDVQTSVMEGAMSQSTATNIPQDSVENLMRQAADEAGLELNMDLPGPAQATVGQSTQASVEQDELSQRLAKLRQT